MRAYGRMVVCWGLTSMIAMFNGCEDDGSLCEQICDCRGGCVAAQMQRCEEDQAELEAAASEAGCGFEMRQMNFCTREYNECLNGDFSDGPECADESLNLTSCLEDAAAETCGYENDGACDEPEGNDICEEGTDPDDCECPSAGDGTCDEPQGTGDCAYFADQADCAPGAYCAWQNDGLCDEPGGTGYCAEGSDPDDCRCIWRNDNECDEPEGTGYCAEGADPEDCQ